MKLRSHNGKFLIRGQTIPATQIREYQISEVEEKETGKIEFSLSSEEPYERWYGTEVLRHQEGCVNLERINGGSASLLFNHNRDDYLGVIGRGWLDNNKLRVEARFELDNDLNPLAKKVHNSVKSGVLKSVSVGYNYDEILFEERDGKDYVIATRWTPLEGSIVTVPADSSVGIGRSKFVEKNWENLKKGLSSEVSSDACTPREEIILEERDEMSQTPTINEIERTAQALEVSSRDVSSILKAERKRISSILAAGDKYNCSELAQRAIEDGLTLEQTRSLFLDQIQGKQDPVAHALRPVELSKKEQKQYSFNRAIAYAAGMLGADKAGLELEVSRHIAQRTGKDPKGIYVDQSQLVRAAYDTGTAAAAGNLIETELLSDRFIEQLYNNSAFLPLGVTYLRDLQGNIEIPREATFQGAYWIGEGTTITEAEGTFDKIALSPKKLAVLSKMTMEMVTQSSIDLENLTRNRLLRALALEIDRAIGFGSGVGEQPLGIVSHPEVSSISLGTNGGAISWASIIAMTTEISNSNAMGSFGFVVNSRTKGKLQTTLDQSTGGGNWIWQQSGSDPNVGTIAGYTARCSNQVPHNLTKGTGTNLSAAIFGDFSNVLLGLWSGMDLMVDPYSDFAKAIIAIRAIQLCDLELTRGDYFSCVTDIITT